MAEKPPEGRGALRTPGDPVLINSALLITPLGNHRHTQAPSLPATWPLQGIKGQDSCCCTSQIIRSKLCLCCHLWQLSVWPGIEALDNSLRMPFYKCTLPSNPPSHSLPFIRSDMPHLEDYMLREAHGQMSHDLTYVESKLNSWKQNGGWQAWGVWEVGRCWSKGINSIK